MMRSIFFDLFSNLRIKDGWDIAHFMGKLNVTISLR